MEDLTLLVQLAGGEQRTVRRLKEAGFGSSADIATGDPEELQDICGLSAAAVRRLIKIAGEQVSSTAPTEGELSILQRNETGTTRSVAGPSPRRRKGKKRSHRSSETTPLVAAAVASVDLEPPPVVPLAVVAADKETAIFFGVGIDEIQAHVMGPVKLPGRQLGIEMHCGMGIGVIGQVFLHNVLDHTQLQRTGCTVQVNSPVCFTCGQLVFDINAGSTVTKFLNQFAGILRTIFCH